ncbi:MAG: HdeD family acid-resistance protein [Gemmatimonadaceae bacterium]
MVDLLARNWGWVALRGVVAILFGALAIREPGTTLAALVLWFGAYALVDGAIRIGSSIANRNDEPRWVALLLGGLVGMAAGLATFFWPGLTAVSLLVLIATWAMLAGAAEIVAALRLRQAIDGEWALILEGVLSLALGVVLFTRPLLGALAVVMWVGAYAVVSGVVQIALAFRLRSWNRAHHIGPFPHPA